MSLPSNFEKKKKSRNDMLFKNNDLLSVITEKKYNYDTHNIKEQQINKTLQKINNITKDNNTNFKSKKWFTP